MHHTFLILRSKPYRSLAVLLLIGIWTSQVQADVTTWYSQETDISEQDLEQVKQIYRHLYDRDFDGLIEHSVPTMNLAYWRMMEPRFIAWFPKPEISAMELVSASREFSDGAFNRLNVALQVRHKKQRVLFQAQMTPTAEGLLFAGFQIQKLQKKLDVNNSTSWQDATVKHGVMLLFMVLVPLFISFTLWHCWRHLSGLKLAFWLVFSLLGVMSFQLNWGSGVFGMELFALSFMGLSFSPAGLYSPLQLAVSVPLGALMYWMFLPQVNADQASQSPSGSVPEDD